MADDKTSAYEDLKKQAVKKDALEKEATRQEAQVAEEPEQPAQDDNQTDSGEPASEALDKALEEVAALKDQILRAKAETENVRRRATQDVEKAHKFALERFTSNLLPVVDSLEKAIESIGSATEEQGVEALSEGVSLALKLFVDTLERSGIKQVSPQGEPFDPQYHEAMSMVESAEAEPGSVLHVLQKGYTLNDRLVRAAMVMVSKEPAANTDEKTDEQEQKDSP